MAGTTNGIPVDSFLLFHASKDNIIHIKVAAMFLDNRSEILNKDEVIGTYILHDIRLYIPPRQDIAEKASHTRIGDDGDIER